jgi:hypothetical protein
LSREENEQVGDVGRKLQGSNCTWLAVAADTSEGFG